MNPCHQSLCKTGFPWRSTRLSLERVESKWGIGHLYRHGLLEVPSPYGDELEYFGAIDSNTALAELVNFARENGVRFNRDA
jgi:hypothetical protein